MNDIRVSIPLTLHQYRFLEKVATKRGITVGVLIVGIVDKLIRRAPKPEVGIDLTPMEPIVGAKANRAEMTAREARLTELFHAGATDEQIAVVLRARDSGAIRRMRWNLRLMRKTTTNREAS